MGTVRKKAKRIVERIRGNFKSSRERRVINKNPATTEMTSSPKELREINEMGEDQDNQGMGNLVERRSGVSRVEDQRGPEDLR